MLVLGVLAAIAVPTFDTVRENSADRVAETTAQAIARNANAISAADGSGGVTEVVDVATAVSELPGMTTLPYRDSDGGMTVDTESYGASVQANSGSYSTCVLITISSEQAVAGSASGSACA